MLTNDQIEAMRTRGVREALRDFSNGLKGLPNNLQNIHTPYGLCLTILNKLVEYTPLNEFSICCLNMEFIEVLITDFGVVKEKIWFVTDCLEKAKVIREHPRYNGVHVEHRNFLEWETDMKFDCMIMNPPYQATKIKEHAGRGKCGKSIWEDFVEKSFGLMKPDGYACSVHPPRWRNTKSEVGIRIKQKKVKYLEIHGVEDGMKNFGCFTKYDWYILQNSQAIEADETLVVDQKGNSNTLVDLLKMPFVPNSMFPEIMQLVAKDGEERVRLLWDCKYHTQSRFNDGTMLSENKGKFKYPCIYSISKDNSPRFWHSSIRNEYHFVPKAIFVTGRSTGMIEDIRGEYGLTQFASGLIDTPKNIRLLVKAMRTRRFFEITDAMSTSTSGIDRDVIACFKRDFWKYFVDEKGNEIP